MPPPVEADHALVSTASAGDSELSDADVSVLEEPGPPAPEPEAEMLPAETEAPVKLGDAAVSPEAAVDEPGQSEPILKAEIPQKINLPLIPPMPAPDGQDVNMITVILRPRADRVRDNLLLRRVFGLMISYPGNDRFAFHIFENGRGHLLEFPNLTTGLNPELITRLTELVGPENIRIEPITFQ
jgi:hypothetical protein